MPNTTSNISITLAAQGWRFVVMMASAMILGRILLPADFGLMATLGPIIGLADLIRDAGFSQAIVQRRDLTREQTHGLFGLMLAASLVIGLIFAVLAAPISHYFKEPRLIGLILAAALAMQISTIASQPLALLNRDLRFGFIALIDCIASTAGLLVGVLVAISTKSYWAIYLSSLSATIITATLSIYLSRWTPKIGKITKPVLEMAAFGGNIGLSNVANFLSRNADNILIARLNGPTQLGLYDRAYKLMLLPLTQITWPIARVMTPVLSRLQADAGAYRKAYLQVITLMAVVSQPALIVAVIASTEVIKLLLGQSWIEAGPIFAWLAAAAVHQVITSSHGWLYLSQGRGKDYVIVGIFGSVTTLIAFLVGIRWGALGVAAAYTISDYACRLPFAWLWVGRSGPVSTRIALGTLAPHVVACAVCALAVSAFRHFSGTFTLLQLGIAGALAYIVYTATLSLFRTKREILAQLAVGLRDRLAGSRV